MNGPNRTSSMPPVAPDSSESKVNDFQKIRDFVSNHINVGKTALEYSLTLGKGSEIYVMREYPLANDLRIDDTGSIERKIRQLRSSGSDFTVVCRTGNENEIMYLHVSKRGPFQVSSVESVSARTRKRFHSTISGRDIYDNNPD